MHSIITHLALKSQKCLIFSTEIQNIDLSPFSNDSEQVQNPYLVELGGISLIADSAFFQNKSLVAPQKVIYPFIITPSITHTLREISLCISANLPILLQGPPSSGKTSLLLHIASFLTPHPLVPIHLGDQSDSKQLLGTYIQTLPGQFEWRNGILTKAVKEGHWVVIEDYDNVNDDVKSVIKGLIETGELRVEGIGRVKAKEGFRIFATRRTERSKGCDEELSNSRVLLGVSGDSTSSKRQVGENLWTVINLQVIYF
jgi:midasin